MSAGPRCVLFGEIAAGGMASVHLGRLNTEAGFGQTVAIKKLHARFAKDDVFVAMLLDEAHLAGRIQHANVVPMLDVVTSGGEVLLVMEYVHGVPLSQLLSLGGPLPPPIASGVMVGMLNGLHAAHEAKTEKGLPLQMVHRDVSPQNVLVGTDGVPRVMDFGIAKASVRLQTTHTGMVKGKFMYMAPEQLDRDEVTRRCDVYAAAVVFWEALVGRPLFAAASESASLARVLAAEVPPPSSLVPNLPAGVDAVILRGLAKSPEARFETAREMADAISRAIPPATALEIGQCVELRASAILKARLGLLEQMDSLLAETGSHVPRLHTPVEMTTEVVREVATVVATEQAPREPRNPRPIASPKRRRPAALLLLVPMLLLFGALVFFMGPWRPTSPRAVGEPVHEPTPTLPQASQPVPEPPPAETRVAPSPQPKQKRPASPVAPAAPAPAPRDCSPPFVIDGKGHKRYKPHCF